LQEKTIDSSDHWVESPEMLRESIGLSDPRVDNLAKRLVLEVCRKSALTVGK